MKKRFSLLLLVLAFALVAAACGGDDADETTTSAAEPATTVAGDETSVLDLAVEAGQFSTLIAAVDAAGLAGTLESEGPFTVLAPTDAAFEGALETLGISAEDLLADTDTLTAILTYHVLDQAADSQLVATLDGQEVPTLNGATVEINVDGAEIMINQASVVSADLAADNGIVHVINDVLLPPDVAAALAAPAPADTTTMAPAETTTTVAPTTTEATEEPEEDPTIAEIVAEAAAGDPAEFTVLLAALEAADLVEALNVPGDELTVFAPTDEAFGELLTALGVEAEDLLADVDTLTPILLYHVAPGVFPSDAVIDSAPIEGLETLNPQGAGLDIDVVDGSVVVNGESTVVQADVTASNGVVHVVDAVLVPAS